MQIPKIAAIQAAAQHIGRNLACTLRIKLVPRRELKLSIGTRRAMLLAKHREGRESITGTLAPSGCVTMPVVHIDRALVAAVLASHEQATDAMSAHAAKRHRADRFVVTGHTSKLRTDRESSGREPM
jgi:precorrin-6B methylase 1